MGELEDELVNHPVDADSATNKLELCVGRVVEDEVVPVKRRQVVPPDAARQLPRAIPSESVIRCSSRQLTRRGATYRRHVVHVWLLHHGAHGVLHGAVGELVVRVLVPDGLEVKVRAPDEGLEEGEAARVGDGLGVGGEVGLERYGEAL